MSVLKSLTGLRFAAAMLVILHHFFWVTVAPGHGVKHMATAALQNVAVGGFVGVTCFFVLSGFILAYTYLSPMGSLRGTARNFWIARAARIYPIYLFGFLLAAIPYFRWPQTDPIMCPSTTPIVTGLASLFLVQSWIPCSEAIWNPPAWSLSCEAFFYLLFPLIGVAIARLSTRWVGVVLIGAWFVLIAEALIDKLGPARISPYAAYIGNHLLYCDPLARLPEFVIGIALGRIFLLRYSASAAHRSQLLRRYPDVVVGLAMVGIVGELAAHEFFPVTPQTLDDAILMPLFSIIIYLLACGQGRIATFFASPRALLLGEASYALYILQSPVWFLLTHSLSHVVHSPYFIASKLFFLAYLVLVVGVSILSSRYIETPARLMIKKRFG